MVPRTGPTDAYLQALNVHVDENVPLEDLVPQPHLPSTEECQGARSRPTNRDTPSQNTHSSSRDYYAPSGDDLCERAKDLLCENEHVFQHLEQRPGTSGARVKISWFRRFWEKLLLVAEYWDTSTDGKHGDPDPISGKTYIGRRLFRGQEMSLSYLEDIVKEFSEPIAWAWRCKYVWPTTQPRLVVGNMRLLVPQTAAICRWPRDRDAARKGFTEGPLIGIVAMTNPEFLSPGKDQKDVSGTQMVLKEITLALMLAQKRARQGQQEVLASNGQWWMEEPRWGGGPGGQIGVLEHSVDHCPDPNAAKRARDSAVRKYQRLQPLGSTWDRGIHYCQVGKDRQTDFDDIYLISAMNHHVAVVRIRVPDRYLRSLTLGSDAILDENLSVQRSPWFDLLTTYGRLHAMRGIWGALAWLMRTDPELKSSASATEQ